MSFEKNEEKSPKKEQLFLGKKVSAPTQFKILLEVPNSVENQCKMCENKNDIIKCIKCQSFYCRECIKKIDCIKQNIFKENELICSDCLNGKISNKKRIENKNITCYICGNEFPEKNIIYYNANQEQKNYFKNELMNKSLSLAEKEETLLLNTNSNSIIKICNNCLGEKKEIIEKIFTIKLEEKEPKKQNNNIIDELTSLISKEKGETFNTLENKDEKNNKENNIKENRSKNKDLFDTFVMEKSEKDINIKKEPNNKFIQISLKKDDNFNKNNPNNNNTIIIQNNINENKNQLQQIIGNNTISKDSKDNINKNKDIINNNNEVNNKNNCLENNNNNILNPNLLERNINCFLNMNSSNQNPPSININSNNKTSNIYIPHFFTTTPLTNTQNINSLIPNINNNITENIIEPSNTNNNINQLNNINNLNNSSNQINQANTVNNVKTTIPPSKLNENNSNKFNNNLLNQKTTVEENKNILPFIHNLNQKNSLGNNIFSFDLNPSNLSNCSNNLNNISEGINKLIGLNESMNNNNNIQSNINDKNPKKDFLFNSINNSGNNINININNNLIGVNNEIKATLNNISKDLHSFDNNNIENNLNILNNIQILTSVFSKIISEQNNKLNNNENNNTNNIMNTANNDNVCNNNINNNGENKIENKKDNINININFMPPNNLNLNDILSNNLNEALNSNPSSRALINYILSVNESLRSQLKTLKMYIEIQKVFVSIIYQNVELFIYNFHHNQNQHQPQKLPSQNKDLNIQNNQNNILSQIKDINTQNNQNNLLTHITPPPQMPLSTLNNLQTLNNVGHSTTSLLNSSNLNYNSPPLIISSMSSLLPNNSLGRGLPLFNFPGQQFKQDFSNGIPNIFNGNPPHFPLYPQQQGVNIVSNPIIGQNIPQMMPILNQINTNGNNNINNNLQNNNIQKSTDKNTQILK